MMWVIRAGQNSLFFDKYLQSKKVYIPWNGYRIDLSEAKARDEFRAIVKEEKKTDNRTSTSNWAGQLYSFAQEMTVGDLVLIPSKGSRKYCLARIVGNYCYDQNEEDNLYHSRSIDILELDIPRDIFSQTVIYSLGAFRTIFRAKHEKEIRETIKKWKAGCR